MVVKYVGNKSKSDASTWRDDAPDGVTRVIATCGPAPADTFACGEFRMADVDAKTLRIHATKNLVISAQRDIRVAAGWLKTSEKTAVNNRNSALIAAMGGVDAVAALIAKSAKS